MIGFLAGMNDPPSRIRTHLGFEISLGPDEKMGMNFNHGVAFLRMSVRRK